MRAFAPLALAIGLGCGNHVVLQGSGGSGTGSVVAASGTGMTSASSSPTNQSASTGAGGSCPSGFADCDGLASNGCEKNVDTDPASCGACGHDCLGGACVTGQCQPVELASGQDKPLSITVDDTSVYWTNVAWSGDPVPPDQGSVMKAPKNGGPTQTLAAGQPYPGAIAVDTAYVYWANQGDLGYGAIMRVPLAGGTPTVVASGQDQPTTLVSLALDDAYVYWTGLSGGTIKRTPKAGGPLEDIVVGQSSLSGLAVDATSVYWTTSIGNSRAIHKAPVGGGPITDITDLMPSGGGSEALVVDATSVYYTADLEVRKLPLDGAGSPVVLGSSGSPLEIAVDSSNAYWTDGVGVFKAAQGGGDVEWIASPGQGSIVVDATAIYWTSTFTGQILKLAK